MLITSLVVGVIVLGIVLVALEANTANVLVDAVLDVANFLVGPFEDVFDLEQRKTAVAVNYGLAALVYFIVGRVIARLLRR